MGTATKHKLKHAYAIRIGEFVEFRSAPFPPKARISRLTRNIIERDWMTCWNEEQQVYRRKMVEHPVKFVMKQVFYIGGTVVGFLPYNQLNRVLPETGKLKVDAIIQLTGDHEKNVLNSAWRRKHLT